MVRYSRSHGLGSNCRWRGPRFWFLHLEPGAGNDIFTITELSIAVILWEFYMVLLCFYYRLMPGCYVLLQFLDLELNHQPQGLGARLPPSIIVAPPVVTLVPVIAPMTILVASLVTLAKRKHVTWAGGNMYIAYNICLKCQIRQILYVYHMYICLFLKEIIYDLNIVCEKIYTLYIFSIDTIYSIYCIYNKFYVYSI